MANDVNIQITDRDGTTHDVLAPTDMALNLMEVNGLIVAHLMERTSNVYCLGAGCFMLQPMGIFMSIKVAKIGKESALHRLILIRFTRCRCLMGRFTWEPGLRAMC